MTFIQYLSSSAELKVFHSLKKLRLNGGIQEYRYGEESELWRDKSKYGIMGESKTV